MRRGMIAAALVWTALVAAVPPGDHAVVAVRSQIEPDAEIGAKRSGLACIRAGSYRWRDVRPSMADAIEIVASTLRKLAPQRMLADDGFADLPGGGTHRIAAMITAATLDACRPTWVLSSVGGGKALRGSVSVTILWRTYAADTRSLRDTRSITTNIALSRTTSSPEEALKAALVANAADYANARWGADTPVPAP